MTGPAQLSPAQRYAASRTRARHPRLAAFTGLYPFDLDAFQLDACRRLEDGAGVLVCAPTGAGKTVVGEFAADLALTGGGKCFYTTPIKALSNQKYRDLVDRYGPDRIGLLTGDVAVNAGAPVVVMTTEIVRNMLYAGSPALVDLRYVVMDEVHYLGDRSRGGVWEEVIIHLPPDVTVVSLSATVSNAEEFGEWLQTVRGDTAVIVHEQRPVPLYQHMLVGRRLLDLFAADADGGPAEVDPELRRAVDERALRYGLAWRDDRPGRGGSNRRGRGGGAAGRGGHGPSRGPSFRPPERPDVIARLDRDGLLPAITFVFSRAGCDAAVRQCLASGLRLTTPAEAAEIDEVAATVAASVSPAELDVLGYWEWLEGLRHGFAAHHAGLIPSFKQAVEQLFGAGLVRAVFATETLALGVNMPARSVVLERLVKFNGEGHVDVTPGEYTQLTGRAGRRGIDVEGHAVVLWSPDTDPARVAGLASARTFPLRSSFRPSYNMAVNLVAQLGRAEARSLLEQSFAQFQADRAVAGLAAQIRKQERTLAEFEHNAECEHGDVAGFVALRAELAQAEKAQSRQRSSTARADAAAALEALRRGDVVRVPAGKRAGLAVVLDPGLAGPPGSPQALADPRPLVLTEHHWAGRLAARDFPVAVDVLASLRVPKHFDHRSPTARRDLAAALRELRVPAPRRRGPDGATVDADRRIAALRRELRAHPVSGCADREDHVRWAQRAARLADETEGLRRRMAGRTGSLGRQFDRICGLLTDLGYLADDHATVDGRMLGRLWSESDLLAAEVLRTGVWEGLDPTELAAVAATLVYEPRREEPAPDRFPTVRIRDAVAATHRLWGALADREQDAGLSRGRAPEPGFSWTIWRWAKGEPLDVVLGAAQAHDAAGSAGSGPGRAVELPAGDFVRWAKQVLDLLDQLSGLPGDVAPGVARTAATAAGRIRRGVVAAGA